MKEATYSAPSVKKAFNILHAIADASAGLGVSELAKTLKIGKSTVHGITSALEELGVLARDPVHKKYNVGYTLLELARKAYHKMELAEVAKIPMERLMEEVGETVLLGILNGDHVTILSMVESQNELKITSPPGTRLPLLVGATGRVFLTQMEEKRAREIVQNKGLVRYTSKSVTDVRRFLKEVEETRKRGYAIDHEEYILGVTAVASPIQTASLPPAAIWVLGFTPSFSGQKLEKAVVETQKAAQEIHRLVKDRVG
jgi:IclR family transcriptional regulator, KDG regulon repressor